MTTTTGKKTMGRQKVQLQYIPDRYKGKRVQTFRKRAFGLIKKAFDLHHLTGSRIRVAISSEGEVTPRYIYDSELGLGGADLSDVMKSRLQRSKYALSSSTLKCTPVAASGSTSSAGSSEDEEDLSDITDSDFMDFSTLDLDALDFGGDYLELPPISPDFSSSSDIVSLMFRCERNRRM